MVRRVSACLFFFLFANCRGVPDRVDELVRRYVQLAVALGERDPDALDYYTGPEDTVSGIRLHPPGLNEIKASATEAIKGLDRVPPARRRFLSGQLRAIIARAELLLGVQRTFDEEADAFFGARPSAPNIGKAESVRKEVAALLPGKGRLVDRYALFEKRFMIREERVPEVLARALQACREQTLARMQLPAGESVRVEYVHNRQWIAFSRYLGNFRSLIQVNADLGLTVDRALQLACHEGYPGHHVFNSMEDQQLVRARHRLEFSVQPAFSPQSFLSEASATVASDMAFTAPERLALERDVLFPLAGLGVADVERYLRVEGLIQLLHPVELSVARDYLDGKLEFFRAGTALQDGALMAHTEASLRYLNEYRTYIVTYTEGFDQVSKWIQARTTRSHDAWDSLRELMTDPDLFFNSVR